MNLRFSKKQILRRKEDFKRVLHHAQYKSFDKALLLLASDNSHDYLRLGVVIAKKNVRLAVQRNRIRRHIKEFVRHQPATSIDVVAVVRNASINRLRGSAIRLLLQKLWQQLQQRVQDNTQS